MKMIRIVSVSSVALSLVLHQGVASADGAVGNRKIYSGLGCTEIPPNVIIPKVQEPYGANDVRYNAAAWAYNNSTQHSIFVACPIVREYEDKPMKSAWITVYNRTSRNIVCEIEAQDANGTFVEQSTQWVFPPNLAVQTQGKSNDKDLINNNDSSIPPVAGYVPQLSNKNGFYVLWCSLPPSQETVDADGAGTGVSFNNAYIIKYVIDEVSN